MESVTIVETHGLAKRCVSGVLSVDSIGMTVHRGEVYGFLGPNGAGGGLTTLSQGRAHQITWPHYSRVTSGTSENGRRVTLASTPGLLAG
jgi:ABC-type branched-subunit amino acid transport system ATPase component